jgi:uncharacterized protein YdhG (YjbR/CyaY superfamily)
MVAYRLAAAKVRIRRPHRPAGVRPVPGERRFAEVVGVSDERRPDRNEAQAGGRGGFTAEERAAMRERRREASGARSSGEEAAAAVLEKIAAMAEPDRAKAERVHAIVMGAAPALSPRLWYGMPAYAKSDKIICHFQDAAKFKTRYATLGFSDKAHLDEGDAWPVAYALAEMTPAVERQIAALVKKAVDEAGTA